MPPRPAYLTLRHMVSTLQALRGGWEVLLSTMDVFLNEPVIEWVEGVGQRQNNDKGELL